MPASAPRRLLPNSEISAPAEKLPPAPVRITARTSERFSSSEKRARSAIHMSSLIALTRWGRFNVTTARFASVATRMSGAPAFTGNIGLGRERSRSDGLAPQQPEHHAKYDGDQDARRQGKEERKMVPLDPDVSGQIAEPRHLSAEIDKHAQHRNRQARHYQDLAKSLGHRNRIGTSAKFAVPPFD